MSNISTVKFGIFLIILYHLSDLINTQLIKMSNSANTKWHFKTVRDKKVTDKILKKEQRTCFPKVPEIKNFKIEHFFLKSWGKTVDKHWFSE